MADITIGGHGELILTCDYDEELVACLKSEIPTTKRRWDGAQQAWLIAPQYWRDVKRIVRDTLGETVMVPVIEEKPADGPWNPFWMEED